MSDEVEENAVFTCFTSPHPPPGPLSISEWRGGGKRAMRCPLSPRVERGGEDEENE